MAHSISLVGLDVHASQTHAAVLNTATGELSGTRLRMAPVEVVDFLAKLPGAVRAVYEAGPTGFGLARAAAERGIDVCACIGGNGRSQSSSFVPALASFPPGREFLEAPSRCEMAS